MMLNSGNSSLTLIFRRISLLIWKNFLFQKRHYVVTALEIVLPTLFAILLAVVKSQKGNGDSWEKVFPEIFEELDEADLVGVLIKKLHFEDFVFAYAPNTALANTVIAELQSVLNGTCVEWKGFDTELEVEAYNLRMAIGNRTATLRGAVIFLEGFDGDNFRDSQRFHYKLRFTNSLMYTSELFPVFQIPGPNFYNEIAYSDQGFSGLQVLIDKILIESLTGNGVPIQEISVQAFPYPPYLQSLEIQEVFNLLMPSLLCLGFIFIVPSVVRGVVGEKETGIKELLKLMGLPNWMHWLGWMMNSLLLLFFSITIVIFLLFFPFNASVGGVVEHSDPTLWFSVLFLYCMASTAFCFFVSSLFQKPTIATTVGIALWLISYFGLAIQISVWKYQSLSAVEKMALCLVPNVAMTFAIKVMGGLEGKGVGARWSNLFEPMSTIDSLSVGIIMLMMICSTVILISWTIFFENILPSAYGVRRPWYYIFKRAPKGKVSSSYGTISRPPSGVLNPEFEADPIDIPPGVEIYNLTKHFGSKVAVDEMTLKMFHGQITALLGQNGAGKTTTMSMLTGMVAPTSGVAIVNGRDISTNLEGVRHDLGLCPQHNMLFDELTVGEHLMFFARLKGLTSTQARSEMVELLKKLQLSDKMDTPTMTLSGGQKRKLNLGIALIGGSKVVFLDEPTSGMDPAARRAVWDLLLEMKEHRTIALTAHSMEEADVLGDRIAIMANGKVQCCGSPMFLKRFYGAGYTLSMTVNSVAHPDAILSTLQKHIESASFKYQHAPNPSEIAFTLPTNSNTTSKFPKMFSELSKDRDALGIETVGLSPMTMDEVFTKVGELSKEGVNDDLNHSSPEPRRILDGMHTNRLSGLRLACQQFYALFVKRMLYTSRKKKLFLNQLLIPVLLIILAIIACNYIYRQNDGDPPLKMSVSSYEKLITPYTTTDDEMGNIFARVVGSSARKVRNNSLEDELLTVAEEDLALYRERYIVGAELSASHIKVMYSTIPSHASPLAINLASNTILRKLTPGENFVIEISAQPMKSINSDLVQAAKPKPLIGPIISLMFAMILPLGLALVASSFVVFPLEERLCKAKQLQLMTGVNPLIFWVSSLLWDFLLAIGVVCMIVACFPIFQSPGSFTAYGGGGILLLILVVYSFTAINFSYVFSLFPPTVGVGFSLLTIFHVFSGTYLCVFVFVMELSGFIFEANVIRMFARFFPTFGAAMCTMKFMEIATRNIRCDLISKEAMAILCNPGNQIEAQLRSCCKLCTKLIPTASCFEPEPYLLWSSIKLPDNPEKLLSYNENDFVIPGIGQELMWLFLVGIMYLFILLAVEFGVIKRILSVVLNTESSVFQGVVDDADVREEAYRVRGMVTSGNMLTDAMIVNSLSKSFGSFAALSNISFGVHHGECFGLLEVNGAGKTSTLRILTGDEVRSSGNAFTSSCTLETSRRTFLANIGYCPQFDGIVGALTGQEMLELFCRLRGVDSALIHSEAMRWLGNLGLTSSANVQCCKYSGGMKRRLSAAMALIGDPPVVLLDEPTSGVDPMARRQFWKVIGSVRDSGQAVILTSHSMEECEALCSRLGIMVNGQMQCLGGVQHLKNKFAQGYNLIVKLRSMVFSDVASEMDVLSEEITTKFHPCTLREQHQNVLQYQILNKSLPWEFLFQTMEDLKRDYEEVIEEYSLNETTLEEVFLSFARKQYPNRQVDVSFLKKLITSYVF